jgi:hypothetical protein
METEMSRSWKRPIIRISYSINKFIRRRWRHIVKQELKKPDPDTNIISTDVKDSGLPEWGTWLGCPCESVLKKDPPWEDEEIKKATRK